MKHKVWYNMCSNPQNSSLLSSTRALDLSVQFLPDCFAELRSEVFWMQQNFMFQRNL